MFFSGRASGFVPTVPSGGYDEAERPGTAREVNAGSRRYPFPVDDGVHNLWKLRAQLARTPGCDFALRVQLPVREHPPSAEGWLKHRGLDSSGAHGIG